MTAAIYPASGPFSSWEEWDRLLTGMEGEPRVVSRTPVEKRLADFASDTTERYWIGSLDCGHCATRTVLVVEVDAHPLPLDCPRWTVRISHWREGRCVGTYRGSGSTLRQAEERAEVDEDLRGGGL